MTSERKQDDPESTENLGLGPRPAEDPPILSSTDKEFAELIRLREEDFERALYDKTENEIELDDVVKFVAYVERLNAFDVLSVGEDKQKKIAELRQDCMDMAKTLGAKWHAARVLYATQSILNNTSHTADLITMIKEGLKQLSGDPKLFLYVAEQIKSMSMAHIATWTSENTGTYTARILAITDSIHPMLAGVEMEIIKARSAKFVSIIKPDQPLAEPRPVEQSQAANAVETATKSSLLDRLPTKQDLMQFWNSATAMFNGKMPTLDVLKEKAGGLLSMITRSEPLPVTPPPESKGTVQTLPPEIQTAWDDILNSAKSMMTKPIKPEEVSALLQKIRELKNNPAVTAEVQASLNACQANLKTKLDAEVEVRRQRDKAPLSPRSGDEKVRGEVISTVAKFEKVQKELDADINSTPRVGR